MDTFVRALTSDILDVLGARGRLVAIDGVDGSGKTCFAANLADAVRDRPVIVIHADDFLNPSPVRHAQGRHSPRGFWEDTYNYDALREHVLEPLSAGDDWYRSRGYDASTDTTVRPTAVQLPSDDVIVVEGMFLHRDELVPYWDASVLLDVPFSETAARMSVRDGSNRPGAPFDETLRGGPAALLRSRTPVGTSDLCGGQLRRHVSALHMSSAVEISRRALIQPSSFFRRSWMASA